MSITSYCSHGYIATAEKNTQAFRNLISAQTYISVYLMYERYIYLLCQIKDTTRAGSLSSFLE